MQNYKIVSDTGVMLEGSDEAVQPGTVIELDPAAEQTIALLDSGAIEVVAADADEEDAEEEKDGIAVPATPGSDTDVEPRDRYNGIVVLNRSPRVVGEQTFTHIVCADGTEYDLTDEEMRTKVYSSYPAQA